MAPPPSEARTVQIDTNTDVDVFPYTCESGYSLCAYLINPSTGTAPRSRTIGGWVVSDQTSTNRARVRIQDLGGTGGNTSIDKMNITGVKFTPVASGTVTTHVKISHTYSTGQAAGDYHFGFGVTGVFDPPGTTTVVGDHFIVTGTGTFNSGTDIVGLGTIDRGSFSISPGNGLNGDITGTIPTRSVKNPCNTNNTNVCTPTIAYDLQITSVGLDALVLSDSGIACGISVPAGEDCTQKPAGAVCRQLKKCGAVLTDDARKGSNSPTCIDTDTCGNIVINKTIAEFYEFGGSGSGGGACGQGGLCPNTPIVLSVNQTQTFNFDGTGFGIYPFDISITDVVPTGSQSLNFLDTTSDTRIIRETGFPAAFFPPTTCSPANPCFNDVYWYTKAVVCTPASGGPEGFVYTPVSGLKNLNQNLDGTLQRSGYVEVTSLGVNPAGGPVVQLTCTFVNGIFELRQ